MFIRFDLLIVEDIWTGLLTQEHIKIYYFK